MPRRSSLPTLAGILLTVQLDLSGPSFGQELFNDSQIPNGGGAPAHSLVVGEFNGDSHPDLAVAIADTPGKVSLLLGNGNGTFSSGGTVPAGAYPYGLIVSDFNGDGKQDLAVANEGTNDVSVLLGNGSGGFVGSQTVAVGAYPRFLVAGDFDEDGDMDLAVSSQGYSISVLIGNGNGTFQTQVVYAAGDMPRGIVAADFNSDDHVDLAVLNRNDYTLSLFRGHGDGTFEDQIVMSSGLSRPNSLVSADFNSDGNEDVAIGGEGTAVIALRLGDGAGSLPFNSLMSTGPACCPLALAKGDFNGDGKADLVSAEYFYPSDVVAVLLGVGNGEFANYLYFSSVLEPEGVATGDFNGDGFDDIAVSTDDNDQLAILMNQAPFPATCSDADGDGFGSAGTPACSAGALDDCNDGVAGVHPGSADVCDGIDNNCDGLEGYDRDQDGYRTCGGDCDDSRFSTHPNGHEVCDGIDQDCNGVVDVPAEEATSLQFDSDVSFSWNASTQFGATFNVYRGVRTSGSSSAPICFLANQTSASASDAQSPAAGTGFFYLVSGRNACGEGTLGFYSSGAPRLNTLPCP